MGAGVARRGLMLVLSSPSGAGKTTLARRLIEQEPDLELSVSHTTRPRRKGEQEGKDYRFVDRDSFTRMRDRGEFLEWAVVFDNFYGTPRAPVEAAIARGGDILFDIDWHGAQQLSEKMKHDVVRVFILPPSADVLAGRLRARAQDADAVVKRRMAEASDEISHWPEYDYVLVNADLETSVRGLMSILGAERLKRERLDGLSTFVREMQKAL